MWGGARGKVGGAAASDAQNPGALREPLGERLHCERAAAEGAGPGPLVFRSFPGAADAQSRLTTEAPASPSVLGSTSRLPSGPSDLQFPQQRERGAGSESAAEARRACRGPGLSPGASRRVT